MTAFLRNKGILVEERPVELTEPRDERWDRQVRFFNSFESHELSGLHFQTRLRAARVVVLGAGGFGSWLAYHLGMIGIGNLIIIDFDTIEMSNLGRCPFYRVSQIGESKVRAVSAYFSEHFPDTRVSGVEQKILSEGDLGPHLVGIDFLFIPFGYHPAAYAESSVIGHAIRAALTASVPHMCVGANIMGPTWMSDEDPCLFCAYGDEKIDACFREDPQPHHSITKRQFAPIIAQTCARAVTEMTYAITGAREPSSKKAMVMFDPLRPERSNQRRFPKYKECLHCRGATW